MGIFNSAHVFDPTVLDILEAEVVWVLYVDVVCLNHDGNAFDLCLLAALAALEDTSLPALVEEKPAHAGSVAETSRPRLAVAPSGVPDSSLVASARAMTLKS